MRNGFLLVLSGPSGVGKGTVCEALAKDPASRDLKFSVSATTRSKRPNEENGKSYFYYSMEEFQETIEKNGFLEYAKVHGNFYGTPRDFVFQSIREGNIVILEIDVQGALQVKKNVEGAVFVFLLPPNMEELRARIEKRGTEDDNTINLRMKNALTELEFIDEYDYAVINDEVESTVKKIQCIIEAEKHKVTELNQRGGRHD